MNKEELLFELFKVMFFERMNEEYTNQISEDEVWKTIHENKGLRSCCIMLDALAEEYQCIQKFK